MSNALLSPADLTFNGAYPAVGWRRCDDYSVDRNLERFRTFYRIIASAAAIWEYGSGCNSADQEARLDEYAWLLQSESAALELSGTLLSASYFDYLPPQLRSQLRQFERDSMVVRTLAIESSGGQRQYVAEIIGQANSAVMYMRATTETELADADYLGMGRLCLDRLRLLVSQVTWSGEHVHQQIAHRAQAPLGDHP